MRKTRREIKIDGRPVGEGHAPFIIAEVGINHNGDLARAIEMVRIAKDAGADAVKFQTFQAAQFCGDPMQTFTYRSQGAEVTESMLVMFRRCELPRQAWFEIKAECTRVGITFMSTPQNRSDLELLLEVGVPVVKIGSDDFTNLPLIRDYASTGLPLILSCGMADLAEVHQALEASGALDGYPVAILLCTSQYPTPPQDVNLRKLATLQCAFPGLVVGFSDHTQGPQASSLAAAMGAAVFEKHFTLDHNAAGPDHWFSENPQGLTEWVLGIRNATVMLGSDQIRPTRAELEMRTLARRSLVALTTIPKGMTLTADNVGVRRPGTGLPPSFLQQIVGTVASREILAGEVLQLGDMVK
jgi:N,N'-diacetyllegionaminate synthase